MLTPEQINQIRQGAGLKTPSTSNHFVGKYDHLLTGEQAPKKDSSFLGDFGVALKKRFGSLKETAKDTASGKINPLSTGLQTVGAGAGLVGDIFGAGLNKITPEPVKEKLSEVTKSITDTEPAQKVLSSYLSFRDKHPEAAKDLESAVNILSLLPMGKGASIAGKGIKTGAEAIETGAKATLKAGGEIIDEAGQLAYKTAIPLSKLEAGLVQTYKAKNPLVKRLFQPLEEQPRTAAITALEKGFAGTEEMIGIQAKKESAKLWTEKIAPAVKAVKEKYDVNSAFKSLEKKIMSTAEKSRRNSLLDGLEALKEDYKGVSKIGYEKAQAIKSGLGQFIPDKAYKGKPIASAFREVQKMFADDIRKSTYKVLKDVDIKTDYLDYGNLKGLAEWGKTAMTGGKAKGGFGSFVSNLYDKAIIPTFTTGGKLLHKVGSSLKK
jgi:hypothetical protein